MPVSQVTLLLSRARDGDADALSDLVGRLYEELRTVARSQRRRLGAADTVNTTAVVHEAYARLEGGSGPPAFNDRSHFFRVAAAAMRGVIVDYARSQSRVKRGGPGRPVGLEDVGTIAERSLDIDQTLALDVALKGLARIDAEAARIVELRYFAGLTLEEAALALGVSPSTVKRRWTMARAWLHRHLEDEPTDL